jgi:hypothetical protein
MTPLDPADPVVAAEPVQAASQKSWMPTRKWFASRVTALAALAVMWATTGAWDQEETIAAIGLVSAAALAYILKNDDTPGGVPTK